MAQFELLIANCSMLRPFSVSQGKSSAAQGAIISYFPGCPEDYEVSRSIFGGALIKQLISGRIEIFHPDGTVTLRNPTEEELQRRLEVGQQSSSQQCLCDEAITEDLLRRMLLVYKDTFTEDAVSSSATLGRPGHWVRAARVQQRQNSEKERWQLEGKQDTKEAAAQRQKWQKGGTSGRQGKSVQRKDRSRRQLRASGG
eukprot:s3885_g2.t1